MLLYSTPNETLLCSFQVNGKTGETVAMFSPKSPFLKNTLTITGILLAVFFCCGSLYYLFKRLRVRKSTEAGQCQNSRNYNINQDVFSFSSFSYLLFLPFSSSDVSSFHFSSLLFFALLFSCLFFLSSPLLSSHFFPTPSVPIPSLL